MAIWKGHHWLFIGFDKTGEKQWLERFVNYAKQVHGGGLFSDFNILGEGLLPQHTLWMLYLIKYTYDDKINSTWNTIRIKLGVVALTFTSVSVPVSKSIHFREHIHFHICKPSRQKCDFRTAIMLPDWNSQVSMNHNPFPEMISARHADTEFPW